MSLLVDYYGDGTNGADAVGIRGKGFDVDSKVQVFETTIRGVGGLLSAHLFAAGDLPIRGYNPSRKRNRNRRRKLKWGRPAPEDRIEWSSGFVYDGQLLRLAYDLGERLLPAFYTPNGIPYPRVNLRYGIPFYSNSPLNADAENGHCSTGAPEITETCSAGAGSLILEFTTLSRLTGDGRFEQVAKRAFHAVWSRRSPIGLVGAGIDADSGLWTGPYTGIGAGIDSFYEYAFKSYIFLSGLESQNYVSTSSNDPNRLFNPLSSEDQSPETFLNIWLDSHASIKRHLYQESPHPHYINSLLSTGSPQVFWVDSLSAYYPGLLALAGNVEEAISTHLLYTALWTRYSALPERWSARTGSIDNGLSWWGGRPEFSESNYHLYRVTKDPWYLYVGSMIVSDIKRRCWAKCGFSGLQDVRSGERSDRQESFFLGETAKYLFLLFDESHPFNTLDVPFVFTTEGHPLIIPREERGKPDHGGDYNYETCPLPPPLVPLTISSTASRGDVFHAANLARLHLIPNTQTINSPLVEFSQDHPSISLSDLYSPTNYTFFPWTLPADLLPFNGFSTKLKHIPTFDIQFPSPSGPVFTQGAVRIKEGIMINSLAGMGLGLIRDDHVHFGGSGPDKIFRIHRMGNMPLGRDEKVFIGRDLIVDMIDPNFSRIRDTILLDIVVDTGESGLRVTPATSSASPDSESNPSSDPKVTQFRNMLNSLLTHFSLSSDQLIQQTPVGIASANAHPHIPAIISTGLGAAPLPDVPDANNQGPLLWSRIFVATDSCRRLPEAAKKAQVIIMRRGGCSFSTKLETIPSSRNPPLVIIVSYEEEGQDDEEDGWTEAELIKPLLDRVQKTPSGLLRRQGIPLVLVEGGERTWELLVGAKGIGIRRRYHVHSQGVPVGNLIVV